MKNKGGNKVVREFPYTDQLLADRTVHRRYAAGREEWRTRSSNGMVTWRDNGGGHGTDEPLADRLIKRANADGSVLFGRDIGFGRTLWCNGVMTVNRSSSGGRVGLLLAFAFGSLPVGLLPWPPDTMTAAQEEALRQQFQMQQQTIQHEVGVEVSVSWEVSGADSDDFG
jgi:hypothetical protein